MAGRSLVSCVNAANSVGAGMLANCSPPQMANGSSLNGLLLPPACNASVASLGSNASTTASNNSGHNTHAVCVWEYEVHGVQWLPYSPAVSQHLERAHAKKLTRVMLSDADPMLEKFYVNIRTMTQEAEDSDASTVPVSVRRMFYTPSSPAGKGTKWEWWLVAGAGANGIDGQWQPYNMCMQCVIEEAWAKGEQTLDLFSWNIGFPYTINFCNLTQTRQPNGPVRNVRRTQQAPYPLVKLTPQQALQLTAASKSYTDYAAAAAHHSRHNTLPKAQPAAKQPTDGKSMQRFALPRPAQPLPTNDRCGGHQRDRERERERDHHHHHAQHQQHHPVQQQQQQQQQHHHHHQQPPPPPPPQQQSRKSHKKNSDITTTNLRQILNNLNIFGHSTKHATAPTSCVATSSGGGSVLCNIGQQQQQLPPFSHSKNMLTSSMSSHHSRCSDGSLQSSQRSSRIGSHRSRSRTRASDTDATSMKSMRRPSVDTVSTYLSHESKESLRSRNFAISVNDLLDCSLGSDDVFTTLSGNHGHHGSSVVVSMGGRGERAPAPPPIGVSSAGAVAASSSLVLPSAMGPAPSSSAMAAGGSIVGVDPASDMISRFVKVVEPPQWPHAQPCPMCMEELVHNPQNPAISLSRCQHLMHLQCLNGMIIAQQSDQTKSLFIECPVCGIVYGEKVGNQPAGNMSWSIISKCLPGHEGQNTIQIVYDIASSIQTLEHPHPGRAFFAVGFPRVCYLPDCPLGRKVLRFLKIAFDRRLLFSIGRSVTTGREDVVIWNSVDHKTQFNMFPDPMYLQRCMQQLVHLGVTD